MFNKIFSKIFFLFSLFISESIFSQTIQDLERRMKVEQNVDENDSEIKIDEGNIENINPKMADIQPYKLNVDKSKEENIFFGYDFFTKRDTVSFWENLPAPSNYIIGPGDELIISNIKLENSSGDKVTKLSLQTKTSLMSPLSKVIVGWPVLIVFVVESV